MKTELEDKAPRLLRAKEVSKRTGLPRSTLYLYIKNGLFPAPHKLGPRTVAWTDAEVDRWIASRCE